jgi:hypothetical protein
VKKPSDYVEKRQLLFTIRGIRRKDACGAGGAKHHQRKRQIERIIRKIVFII